MQLCLGGTNEDEEAQNSSSVETKEEDAPPPQELKSLFSPGDGAPVDGGDHDDAEPVPEELPTRTTLETMTSKMNPFRVEDHRDDEVASTPKTDLVFGGLWFGCLVIFAAVVISDFLGRESVTATRLARSSDGDVPAIPVDVALACSTPWGCYDGWGQERPTDFVTVTHAYAATDKCAGDDARTVTDRSAEAAFEFELCYSPSYGDGVDVTIPFDEETVYGDEGSPVLSVTITSPRSTMYVELDVEPGQRKTVFVGQTLKEKQSRSARASFLRQAALADDDAQIIDASAEPFQSDLFYDGKNANRTALLRIRASQFAQVSTITRPGTWFEVLAALGGANVFIWTVASHSRDLFLEITGHGFVAAFYDCVQGILGN